jgi:hypothetical protein
MTTKPDTLTNASEGEFGTWEPEEHEMKSVAILHPLREAWNKGATCQRGLESEIPPLRRKMPEPL